MEYIQSCTAGVEKLTLGHLVCHGGQNSSSIALQLRTKLSLGHLELHERWNISSFFTESVEKIMFREPRIIWNIGYIQS